MSAWMPPRLTLPKDATPFAFVVALPTLLSFKVKSTLLLGIGLPLALNTARREVVPPYVPTARLTARLDGRSAIAGILASTTRKSSNALRAPFEFMLEPPGFDRASRAE